MVRQCLGSATEEERQTGAEAEIVLVIVEAVGDARHQVFDLHRTERKMSRKPEVQPAACGHCEVSLPSGVLDS